MRNQGVGSWAARRAHMAPGRTALIFGDRTWTYGELYERTTRLAHALRELGVRYGDRVAYLGPNHPAFLETLFAAGTLGAILVPLNARLAAPEIEFILADSGTNTLVYGPEQADTATAVGDRAGVRHPIALDAAKRSGGALGHGVLDYEETLGSGSNRPMDEPVSRDDVCMIMYTSGTTGRPKGAVITHGNVTWNCMNVLLDVDLVRDEVTLISAPLFHTAALNMTCLPTLVKGGTAVIMAAFDPDRAFDLIEKHRVTWMFGVPTMFNTMAQSPRWPDADLSSVRMLECGGAPVPESLIGTYRARGLTFLQGYGMTETAPGALFLGPDSVDRVGSAGKSSFFTEVRVVRPDGEPVAPGEPGEIVVEGPNVMKGYWGRPADTAQVLSADGWFHSGDAAVVDDDGFVYVIDRMKDMFISGGENVYPAEVEEALYGHPAVSECAVIGVADEKWGEVGRAFVVLRPDRAADESDLLGFLPEKIATYKVPKSVTFVAEIPRNASGKIQKQRLRERHT